MNLGFEADGHGLSAALGLQPAVRLNQSADISKNRRYKSRSNKRLMQHLNNNYAGKSAIHQASASNHIATQKLSRGSVSSTGEGQMLNLEIQGLDVQLKPIAPQLKPQRVKRRMPAGGTPSYSPHGLKLKEQEKGQIHKLKMAMAGCTTPGQLPSHQPSPVSDYQAADTTDKSKIKP